MSIVKNLLSEKWQKFLSRVWLFKFIPFVDFVLASGSLATGNPRTQRAEQSSHDENIRDESDFDVIIGVRQGRIFSVRMFCYLSFGMFGLWAKHPGKSKNRLCFNHFVTPNAYRLSPPYNEYWKKLYQSLVPVYGSPEIIQKFYDANADWMGERRIYADDARHLYKKSNWIKLSREWMLSEKIGDWLEKKLKSVQIAKIKSFANNQNTYAPRIIFNDNELEFHPNTKRIQEYVEKLNK